MPFYKLVDIINQKVYLMNIKKGIDIWLKIGEL